MAAARRSDRSRENPARSDDSAWRAGGSACRTRARRRESHAAAPAPARPLGPLPDRTRQRRRPSRCDRSLSRTSIPAKPLAPHRRRARRPRPSERLAFSSSSPHLLQNFSARARRDLGVRRHDALTRAYRSEIQLAMLGCCRTWFSPEYKCPCGPVSLQEPGPLFCDLPLEPANFRPALPKFDISRGGGWGGGTDKRAAGQKVIGHPGCRCRRLQPADGAGRGRHARAAQASSGQPDRSEGRGASRPHRQDHRRRHAGGICQRGRCGALRRRYPAWR